MCACDMERKLMWEGRTAHASITSASYKCTCMRTCALHCTVHWVTVQHLGLRATRGLESCGSLFMYIYTQVIL